ncbi:outer membrane lipoprotein-sorting protein [Trinickia dinghuensis]|uniref:Outer membrane lipoprotein-sorting protein n=1 Tax=Trinickia dinghuensis TaxID=2291023 RepID=A0A3D8K6R3_9BURK|nr:outer membrane lipoprotein-sorting protein [Trinickia dinghuensis]RDV00565.1 outer membrane lipoprotein-sorting protein [Trinickia dinghuensis]
MKSALSRWFAVITFCVSVAANASPSAQQLLEASDAIRNPGKPFSLTTTLIEFHQGRQTDQNILSVYSKIDPDNGQYRSLVHFDAPARDVDKLLLKNGLDLWFYDPSSQASVRISPQQRLLGQAANGDVVTVNWAHDYTPSLAGEEDIADGDRQTKHCYKLALVARSPEATYHAIDLWLDSATMRPVKARFYAESGTLLKVSYFRRFQEELGAVRPTEIVIIDGLDPGWVTVMRYSNYAWRDIPDSWMQREYLARFKPN